MKGQANSPPVGSREPPRKCRPKLGTSSRGALARSERAAKKERVSNRTGQLDITNLTVLRYRVHCCALLCTAHCTYSCKGPHSSGETGRCRRVARSPRSSASGRARVPRNVIVSCDCYWPRSHWESGAAVGGIIPLHNNTKKWKMKNEKSNCNVKDQCKIISQKYIYCKKNGKATNECLMPVAS